LGTTLSATWASDVDTPTTALPFDCSDNADVWEQTINFDNIYEIDEFCIKKEPIDATLSIYVTTNRRQWIEVSYFHQSSL